MLNVKQLFYSIVQLTAFVAISFSVYAESASQLQPSVAQNFVMGDVARVASKLYIAPFIASYIKQAPRYCGARCQSRAALTHSMAHGFNSQTRADAANSMYQEQGLSLDLTTTEPSLAQEIVSGEVGVQTEILTREVLAHIVQYLKLATIEQDGAYRLGMDYCGTSYEVASDVANSYAALRAHGETECAGVYAGSTALGFITAYMNLFLSGLVAGYPRNPLLQTMTFLAVYMFMDPVFKRMSAATIAMDQCPGASELYGFGGDFCYFATGVVPDNMNFAHQVH